MSSTTNKINIDVPKINVKKMPTREVPEGMPNIDNGGFIGGIIGSRGASKTTRMLEMVLMYDKTETFDHTIMFSPTFSKDPKYQYLVDHLKGDIETYDDFSGALFQEIKEKVEKRLEEYKRYEEYKKVYERFMKYRRSIMKFPQVDLLLLLEHNFEEPFTEYKNGAPHTLMIFDDLNYCKELYSNSSSGKHDIKRTMILHRHIKTSMLFLCQTYRNGVPKSIRNNLSLLILFKNKSPEMRKEISMELSSHIEPEKFVEMWNDATSQPYAFFMIDYDSKDPNRRFRKNWDTMYVVEEKDTTNQT